MAKFREAFRRHDLDDFSVRTNDAPLRNNLLHQHFSKKNLSRKDITLNFLHRTRKLEKKQLLTSLYMFFCSEEVKTTFRESYNGIP